MVATQIDYLPAFRALLRKKSNGALADMLGCETDFARRKAILAELERREELSAETDAIEKLRQILQSEA